MLRAVAVARSGPPPSDRIALDADERHLRRRMLTLELGERVLVDLPSPVRLRDRDRLVLEDGRHVEVIAAEEALCEARCDDPSLRARIAWALGNRHARVELTAEGVRFAFDHVLRDMLLAMGARVSEVRAPFEPEIGLAHVHGHAHSHGHEPHGA